VVSVPEKKNQTPSRLKGNAGQVIISETTIKKERGKRGPRPAGELGEVRGAIRDQKSASKKKKKP